MATGSERRKGGTLVDEVYQEILQRILHRQWGDGHHVLEQEVADELGTSRTPVRLALSRLQSDGLIEVIPRHGIRVLPMSPREVRETYEIFTRLESLAILPGDSIGEEVMDCAAQVLAAVEQRIGRQFCLTPYRAGTQLYLETSSL